MRTLPSAKELLLISSMIAALFLIAFPEYTLSIAETLGLISPQSAVVTEGTRPSVKGTVVLAVLHERFDLPGESLGKMTPSDIIDCLESVYPTSVRLVALERARRLPNIPPGELKRILTLALRNYEPSVRRHGLLLLGNPPVVPISDLNVYLESDPEREIRDAWKLLLDSDPERQAKRLRSLPPGVDANFSARSLR